MITCKQASQFISNSLDRPLTLRERLTLKLHLLLCKYCKRFNQQLIAVHIAIKQSIASIENDQSITMPTAAKERLAALVKMTDQ